VLRVVPTAPSPLYTLSLHDALPISGRAVRLSALRGQAVGAAQWGAGARPCGAAQWSSGAGRRPRQRTTVATRSTAPAPPASGARSEEHTSELQSRENLVCRLLLEKK